ncbi:MAG: hypothetical protein ACI4P4_17935 [Faecousia sp.]
MVRKRILRWMAGVILITLVALTAISNGVYKASLPRVRTRLVEQEIGGLLDGYGLWETFAWIPKECVFPGSSEDVVRVYRIETRAGQFTRVEYYADAVEVRVLDEREDAVLAEDLYLSFYETLVCETSLPLMDGQVVVWLNGE